MTDTDAPARAFTLTRHLLAPREAVFRAWTEPAQLHWFAGVPAEDAEATVDLRVGGSWRVRLVEDNEERRMYWTGGRYREVVEPERLVFSWGAAGGWPPLDFENPDDVPVVSIDLAEADGGAATDLTLRVEMTDQMTDSDVRDWLAKGIRAGWSSTLDRLPKLLAGELR